MSFKIENGRQSKIELLVTFKMKQIKFKSKIFSSMTKIPIIDENKMSIYKLLTISD